MPQTIADRMRALMAMFRKMLVLVIDEEGLHAYVR